MTTSQARPSDGLTAASLADVETLRRQRGAVDDPLYDAAWATVYARIDQRLRRVLMHLFRASASEHDDWLQDLYLALPTLARQFRGTSWPAFVAFCVTCCLNAAHSKKRVTGFTDPVSYENAELYGDERMETRQPEEEPTIAELQRARWREAFISLLRRELIPKLKPAQQAALLSQLAGEGNPEFAAARGLTTKEAAKLRENAVKRLVTMVKRLGLAPDSFHPAPGRSHAPSPIRDKSTGSAHSND